MCVREWHFANIHAELITAPSGPSVVGHTHRTRHALLMLRGCLADDGHLISAERRLNGTKL